MKKAQRLAEWPPVNAHPQNLQLALDQLIAGRTRDVIAVSVAIPKSPMALVEQTLN